ncbi:chemotaxis protein CheD [Alkaliphilus oremlandii]|uniref:Probable chemoreceptor glutamine deamidase CheD n=1 Tax=Alkaliphilus oremlandii (strain OhILAs) TaxID=350688 RepID=A8MHG5_ALKOO|nr:chemotaxis protein CheD [Alkaliphilus oremlandii]ABW19052.1 CheD, stimulates methylation of MCP proteins [Alkaliphilus oremlandii OhILAs]
MQMITKVGMADMNITKDPGVITTLGLGSCVGIVLYDQAVKVAGLVHIMLPNSKQIKNNENKAKFADTGIELLLQKMIEQGCSKSRIIAKIAGGSQMFSFQTNNDVMKIGERNVVATKEILQQLKIPLLAQDTGGNYGRTIEFNSNNGKLLIKTIGHGVHEI